jgi:hypothetical protein
MIRNDACEKTSSFYVDEPNLLEELCQFSWRVEVPYGVCEVANALYALSGTPEKFGSKPYRETQVDEVGNLDEPWRRPKHIIMAEDATRLKNSINLVKRSDDLEMARCILERYGIKWIIGKWQCMSITDMGMNRQFALASAALTFGCHMGTAVYSVYFERWVHCEEPQRDIVRARANI